MEQAAGAVRVEGLVDLRRELSRVNRELPKELRVTHREVAKTLLTAAVARANAMGGIFAKAARAVYAGGDNRDAFLRLRPTKRVPFVLGAEFGAKHKILRWVRGRARAVAVGPATPGRMFRRLGWHQLPEHRGNQFLGSAAGPGFFVYPTIRAEGSRTIEQYEARLMSLLARAFPD